MNASKQANKQTNMFSCRNSDFRDLDQNNHRQHSAENRCISRVCGVKGAGSRDPDDRLRTVLVPMLASSPFAPKEVEVVVFELLDASTAGQRIS